MVVGMDIGRLVGSGAIAALGSIVVVVARAVMPCMDESHIAKIGRMLAGALDGVSVPEEGKRVGSSARYDVGSVASDKDSVHDIRSVQGGDAACHYVIVVVQSVCWQRPLWGASAREEPDEASVAGRVYGRSDWTVPSEPL